MQLSLRHCLIDYPATAELIDSVLFKMQKLPGRKELLIVLDYDLPKQTLLNWLFLGSRFFGMKTVRELPMEELEKILHSKLGESEISLEVSILDRSGETIAEYKYEH